MKLRTLTTIGIGLVVYAQISAADQTTPTQTTTTTTAQVVQQAQVKSLPTTSAPVTVTTTTAKTAPTATPAAQTQVTTTTATAANPAMALTTDKDKVSYSIGVDLGNNFKTQNIDIDPTILARGLKDVMSGSPLALTPQQMGDTLMAFQKQMIAQKQAAFAQAGTANKQEGDTFLAANKTKPGVITTTTGLQYKIITKGKGTTPTDSDMVTVDYAGSFLNGKVFDSSYQRGKPVTFPTTQVIPGWTEALKLMQPGATYEIFVPPTLAYGANGFGNVIGPNQTLVFKIHLIDVKKTKQG